MLLSIDWGTKRLGLAIADAELKLVRPIASIANDASLIESLRELVRDHTITKLIVGLPRNLDGAETAMASRVRQFGADLSKQLKLPVAYQDETLTSVAAAQQSAQKTNFDLDSEAAAIILRDYLGVANETLADL